ncbi:cytochrome c oxidase assembly protein [Luteimicrobium xylanilyticum]|uniref:cytochrome c oxidase assembly protein n=1 Tax=Luteimicrobium xylanilyticum TaxID=1133546 RepID=UPI00056C8DA0|nr:cytochrome c oxidase assembly protein [Luteimicrobium xylanilyticum]
MTSASTPARPRPSPGPTRTLAGRPWWVVLAAPGAVVVGIVAALLAGAFTEAFAAPGTGLLDPGVAVRLGLPVATLVTELSMAVTVGSLALALFVLPWREPSDGVGFRRALVTAAVGAGVWAVAGLVQLVLEDANIAGMSLTDPAFGQQLGVFMTQVAYGRTLLEIVVLAAVTSTLLLLVRTPTGTAWTALLPVAALSLQAGTGHAAGTSSHELAISSLFLHLLGASVWIGGLATLGVVFWAGRGSDGGATVRRAGTARAGGARPDLAAVVGRYSQMALWCLGFVAVSGLVNGWIRAGSIDGLATRYGVLLLAKLVLLVVLGLIGYAHRTLVIGRLGRDDARPRGLFWRLAAVELAVMGAVMGVAVALASSAPPVSEVVGKDLTPSERVTGHVLPPALTPTRWFTEWNWDLILTVACAAGVVVYVGWALRLRRRGDAWSWGRTASWCVGMVALWWTTSGGPALYGHVLFSAHMAQHMVLAMVVPIFLVLGAPVTLALRGLPARKDGSRGPREWLLILVHSRWGQFVANPVVSAVLFASSLIVFYYTPLFSWSLHSYVGHLWMVVHFTGAGYLFANALIGIDPGPRRLGYPQRLILLFATMAFHAFFGVALISSETLLVPDWFGLLGRTWGSSAIEDQQTGGSVAWGVGEIPTLLLAVLVATSWARSDEREARRKDRKAERDGDAELRDYNAMLEKLAERDTPPR